MNQSIFVIPCYNEAKRLDLAAFRRFVNAHGGVDFLFVNDGSTDDTLGVLLQLTRENPNRFKLLDLHPNGGKAEAVRQGVLKALEDSPDFVGFLDADLATPLDQIPRLTRVLSEKPNMALAIGIRLPLAGHSIRRNTIRQWIGRYFARVASAVVGLSVFDTQCGAKIFRANELTEFLFSEPFSSRWIFDVEILARFRNAIGKQAAQASMYELPLDEWTEIPGSKLKSTDFLKAIGELATIYRNYIFSSHWKNRYRSLPVAPAATLAVQPEQRRAA